MGTARHPGGIDPHPQRAHVGVLGRACDRRQRRHDVARDSEAASDGPEAASGALDQSGGGRVVEGAAAPRRCSLERYLCGGVLPV